MSDLKVPDQDAGQDAATEDGERSYTESHARSFLKAMSLAGHGLYRYRHHLLHLEWQLGGRRPICVS